MEIVGAIGWCHKEYARDRSFFCIRRFTSSMGVSQAILIPTFFAFCCQILDLPTIALVCFDIFSIGGCQVQRKYGILKAGNLREVLLLSLETVSCFRLAGSSVVFFMRLKPSEGIIVF